MIKKIIALSIALLFCTVHAMDNGNNRDFSYDRIETRLYSNNPSDSMTEWQYNYPNMIDSIERIPEQTSHSLSLNFPEPQSLEQPQEMQQQFVPQLNDVIEHIKEQHDLANNTDWKLKIEGDVLEKIAQHQQFEYSITYHSQDSNTIEIYRVNPPNSDTIGLDLKPELVQRYETKTKNNVIVPEIDTPKEIKLNPFQSTDFSDNLVKSVDQDINKCTHVVNSSSEEISNKPQAVQSSLQPLDQHHINTFKYWDTFDSKLKPGKLVNENEIASYNQRQLETETQTKLQELAHQIADKLSPTLYQRTYESFLPKNLEALEKEKGLIASRIKNADLNVQMQYWNLESCIHSHNIDIDINLIESVHVFAKDCAGRKDGYENMQHLLQHNFSFLKPEIMPEILEHSKNIAKAENELANFKMENLVVNRKIEQYKDQDPSKLLSQPTALPLEKSQYIQVNQQTTQRSVQQHKNLNTLLEERKLIAANIEKAQQKAETHKKNIQNLLTSQNVDKKWTESVYIFGKKSITHGHSYTKLLLNSNFSFIKPEMMPKIVEFSAKRQIAENKLSYYKTQEIFANQKIEQYKQQELHKLQPQQISQTTTISQEQSQQVQTTKQSQNQTLLLNNQVNIPTNQTLDSQITTPTTSIQAYELMKQHGMELPKNLEQVAPEFVKEINSFVHTHEAFAQQIEKSSNKSWKEAVHSIRTVIERVAVRAIQIGVEMAQYNDRMEMREYAKSIGKLAKLEQHARELIKVQNEYIEAGIKGPLNALEGLIAEPDKKFVDTIKGFGSLAHTLGYKFAELGSAADLIENGKISQAQEIYTRVNIEISTLAQAVKEKLSSMTGPQIFEAITEFGTDCFLMGQAFKACAVVLGEAKLANLCPEECLTRICQETSCQMPQNTRELIEVMAKKYPGEFKPAVNVLQETLQIQKTSNLVDIETAEKIVNKIKQGIDLNASEVRSLIKMSPEHAKNLEQLEQTVEKLNKNIPDTRPGWMEKLDTKAEKILEMEEKATELYKKFVSDATDIATISKNTNIPPDIIARIKNYLFCDHHALRDKVAPFDPSLDQAYAWSRLINGKIYQSDLRLLLHEYTELSIKESYTKIMMKMPQYSIVHEAANRLHNWQNFVE